MEKEIIFLSIGVNEQYITDLYDVSNIFFSSIIDQNDIGRAQLLANVVEAIRQFAKDYLYMLPIRKLPKREFVFSGRELDDLGIYGENAYGKLYSMVSNGQLQNDYLERWVNEFGYKLGWRSTGQNQGKIVLIDEKNGIETNIVDNGFGVGQSLPVIVALASVIDKYMLIDSPESFLQTKMQSIIADYIIEASSKNNMLVIETSSEYLLQRIRRRISEKRISNKNVSVYFIHEENGNAICSMQALDDNGIFISEESEFAQFFSSAYQDVMEMMKGRIEQ